MMDPGQGMAGELSAGWLIVLGYGVRKKQGHGCCWTVSAHQESLQDDIVFVTKLGITVLCLCSFAQCRGLSM